MRISIALSASILVGLASCTATSVLDRTQTAQYYPDKRDFAVAAYVVPELATKKLNAKSATSNCSGYDTEIDAGAGFSSAVISGLSAAFVKVVQIAEPPSPAVLGRNNADFGVTVRQTAETPTITAGTDATTSAVISTVYHTTLALDFINSAGAPVFGLAASGHGEHHVSGTCMDMAPSLKLSMEAALRQVADTIAKACHDAPEFGAGAKVRR